MYALLHQHQLKQSQVTFSSVSVPAVLLVASVQSCLGNQVWELIKDKNMSKFLTAGRCSFCRTVPVQSQAVTRHSRRREGMLSPVPEHVAHLCSAAAAPSAPC